MRHDTITGVARTAGTECFCSTNYGRISSDFSYFFARRFCALPAIGGREGVRHADACARYPVCGACV